MDSARHGFLNPPTYHILECNIPPEEVRAGTAFPRDFPRVEPDGNPEEKLSLPEL